MLGAELRQHHLFERTGTRVLLEAEDAAENVPLGHDVADPQRRRDRLGEGADEDDAFAPGHGVERARALAAPDQVGIALVLEDHDAILGGDLQQLGAARLAHDGAGRILHRRDRVDVLGRDALLLQLLELLLQHVEPQALAVERDADHVGAELVQLGERTAIGLLLDDDGIAPCHEQAVDQVEALHRARGDQDLVRGALDAGMVLELGREEFTQRFVAQRAAVQAVGRKRGALALQDRRRRGDQRVHGHVAGVVVAADEVVLRESVPLGGGCGCAGRQQGRKIERSGHGRFLFWLANCWANQRGFATILRGIRPSRGTNRHGPCPRPAATSCRSCPTPARSRPAPDRGRRRSRPRSPRHDARCEWA